MPSCCVPGTHHSPGWRATPGTQVKLDHSIIARIDEPATCRIVEAIVALGQQLNFEVMAEGVETAAQAQRLLQLGCDSAQGFHYGRPGPLSHLALGQLAAR